VNAPAIAQRIVKNLQSLSVDVKNYERKRDLLYDALTETGYEITKPGGAFYLFPRSPIIDDVRFVRILQQKKVLTVPGTGFGRPGYFRIAYCVSESTIKKSISRFQDVFQEIK
jgi:aspartate aminotransferase